MRLGGSSADETPAFMLHEIRTVELVLELDGPSSTVDRGQSFSQHPRGDTERYSLRVSGPSARVSAASLVGLLRGTETFSQIFDGGAGAGSVTHLALPPRKKLPLIVRDAPRFHWRGVMLDTARHFFPPRDVLRLLHGMSANKLNVLHLHLVDAHSFPLNLSFGSEHAAAAAAWSRRKRYSASDLRRIVNVATELGITVVPELDVPELKLMVKCFAASLTFRRRLVIFQQATGVEPPAENARFRLACASVG